MQLQLSLILLLSSVYLGTNNVSAAFVTQTVYGFLDFTTTIGDTVMVFSPQSAPPLDLPVKTENIVVNTIQTNPIDKKDVEQAEKVIKPTKLKLLPKTLNSNTATDSNKSLNKNKVQAVEAVKPVSSSIQFAVSKPQLPVKQIEQEASEEEAVAIKIDNDLEQHEYDLLSREPAEYAEESYRLVNLKTDGRQRQAGTSTSTHKTTPKQTKQTQQTTKTTTTTTTKPITNNSNKKQAINKKKLPVGLVTKLSGTATSNDENGVTTIYETSVIGTYISGKYAQVLQSSSQVFKNRKSNNKARASIAPSATLRVLKTAAPVLPVAAAKTISPPRVGNFKHRSNKNSNVARSYKSEPPVVQVNAETTAKTTTEQNGGFKKSRSGGKSKRRKNNNNALRASTTSYQPKETSPAPRKFQNKIQHSPVEANTAASSTSLYMFKLNRTPGRWQYKTSPKPRISIRKSESSTNANPLLNSTTAGHAVNSIAEALTHENSEQNAILSDTDLESSGSERAGNNVNNINDPEYTQKMFVETLNVDISTPADFNDTYYEIATIKTPFTFQAGNVKKTRFITVTSTIEKVLKSEPVSASAFNDKPLIENILDTHSSKSADNLILDGSITTLSPLYLSDELETPSLETVTESFSIVQTKLRTQVLPIVFELKNETFYSTFIHTYDFTSLIVATKTLSPFDENQFLPTKNFKDFGGNLDEAGSELNLELEFGDDNPDDLKNDGNIDAPKKHKQHDNKTNLLVPPTLQTADQIQQQLALLKLLNPSAPLNTVLTKTLPVIKLETVWESHVVPIVNAGTTSYRTLSKAVGVVDKTEYRLETTTIPLIPTQQPAPPTQNPYLLPVPDVLQTITNSLVQDTITTAVNSKVLKLTFGARTAYTTIFSTQVMPTQVTMYLTSTIAVQATAAPAFPGYYPPPYPPFAYVG